MKICLYASYATSYKELNLILNQVNLISLQFDFFYVMLISYLNESNINNFIENRTNDNIQIFKSNKNGYDFGSWKFLMDKINLYNVENILFMNSSIKVVCLNSFNLTKQKLFKEELIYFLASSNEIKKHGQSYIFSANGLGIKIISDFFKKYNPSNRRNYTILNGEFGLSEYLLINNIQIEALYKSNFRVFIRFINFILKLGFRYNISGLLFWKTINPILYDKYYFKNIFGITKS